MKTHRGRSDECYSKSLHSRAGKENLIVATILVVDDQPTSRQFLETLLGYQGHRLLHAINGEEALAMVPAETPDLIITDLIMPRMDGYEFVFQLRSNPAIARMPVIFYTAGYDVREVSDLARSCGVFHILAKPADPEVILSNVEAALQLRLPPLPCDRPDEIGWDQGVQTEHRQLLVNKLTQQMALMEREIAVRKEAEETITALNAKLEMKVMERTDRLKKTNARLRLELRENKRARLQIEEQTQQIRQQLSELELQKSQLAEANARLERLASTDGLTSLKNRRLFQVSLEQEFERARRYNLHLSLALVDVDQFKLYNDTFGHPAGDSALKQVAALLEKTVRHSDMVARYGGEEFAIILPSTDREGALMMAERLRETIETAQWPLRPVTISI